MSHSFNYEDLHKLANNDALDNHPDFAKVWRDLERDTLLVTITDDFVWFPESYEFLGHIGQARRAFHLLAVNELVAKERYPQSRVRVAAGSAWFAAS